MNKLVYISIFIALAFPLVTRVCADDDNADSADKKPPKASESNVRADQMDFDFEAGKIFMEGNVIVTDPDMTIRSQEMTVFLTDDNRLKKVVAEGDVRLIQPDEDRTANSEHAVYEVDKGTVTLTKNPRVKMRDNTLENAEKIVFHRDSRRVETHGGSTKLRLPSQGGQESLELPKTSDDENKDNHDAAEQSANDE
ncbi:MAG: LptA/OstA family protein [Verrucomicrobiota bacterium]